MHDLTDWDRLDVAAYRVSMKRSVRRMAWALAVVGAVVLACGIGLASALLSAVGLVLLGAGGWNLCRTSVSGLFVDGVAVVLAGTFQCVAWLWLAAEPPSSATKWIVAGLFQIAWGIRRLLLYRTARRTVNDTGAIARLETMVRELSRLDAKSDPTVAEFRTGRFHLQRCRVGLYDAGAVALLEQQVVRLERRADIWIEPRGTTGLGRSVKVAVRMGDFELPGVMSAGHLERFENWKRGLSRPRAIAA